MGHFGRSLVALFGLCVGTIIVQFVWGNHAVLDFAAIGSVLALNLGRYSVGPEPPRRG